MLPMLAACSSIVEGTSQSISIDTSPSDARCEFVREGQIIGVVDPTPGAVFLDKTKHNINVNCSLDGYEEARAFIKSEVAGATFGNIILGGGIGWIIDSASGADNKYQEYINVTLTPARETDGTSAGNQTAAVLPAPRSSQTWRTKDETIQGHAGARGTGGSILIDPGVDLRLLKIDDVWGQFSYESVSGGSAQVWILMDKVVRN